MVKKRFLGVWGDPWRFVDAVSRADAIQKVLDGDGQYGNGTRYEETCEDGHRVEEI